MTLTLWPLFSLTQSLMEKEQRLLVLQEADSVRQQELSSLHQDLQEAQGGQKELSTQVLPTPLLGPVPRQKCAPAPGVKKPSFWKEDRALVPYCGVCWDVSSPGRRG